VPSSYYKETYAVVMDGRPPTRAELTRMLLEMAATADKLTALCEQAQSIALDCNKTVAEVVAHLREQVAETERHAERMGILPVERENGGGPTGSVH
jgi:fructoselysine-6-P-deglycase FrlB-like protein